MTETPSPEKKNFYRSDLEAVAELLGFDSALITDMHITTEHIDVTYFDRDYLAVDGVLPLVTHRYFITHQTV